ncbi:MAG: hypothetical protein HGA97_10430 [Chlorobiaceae bacterium]|nr:hypothetical protein [Chlorobiaceae bacterium]
MKNRLFLLLLLIATILQVRLYAEPWQSVPAEVRLSGLVEQPLTLTIESLRRMKVSKKKGRPQYSATPARQNRP